MSELHNLCEIGKDIIADCEKPPVRGAKDRILILPRRSIKSYTEDTDNPLIIEDITRKDSTVDKAYEYVGLGKIRSPKTELVEDDYGVKYLHEIEFHVYGTTPAVKLEMTKLARERQGVVAILEQNYREGKSKWLLMGKDAGLYVKEQVDEEGRNIYRVLLGNRDDFEEPMPPANIWDTDEDITDTLVEALLETTAS